MHLFPAGSVKLVRTDHKHYQLGTFLEQVRRASQSVNLAQWGDNTSAESNSRTFYSGPAYFVENMLKEQTRQLLQTCAEDCSLDRNVMLAKLETAYEDLQASFVIWDALEHANNTGEKKWDFSLFAFFIAMALNWKLDTNFLCMQFNFQHYLFPAHTDGCGFLQPKLNGGEGFGNQIAVAQLRGTGETWVYI